MKKEVSIVLLPGLNGTTGLFKPLMDNIPEEYNVLPLSYPSDQKLSYPELKTLIQEKLNTISGSYILLGESFSGPLSLMIARDKPKGLVGIVLVATFVQAPNVKLGQFLPWQLGFTLTKPLYSLRLLVSQNKNKSLINSISTELQKVKPEVLADRIQSIFSVNAISDLKHCEIPLAYFRGTKDFVVPKKNLDVILKHKPDIKVASFETQHFLLQSKPKQAWQEILSFIRSIDTNN